MKSWLIALALLGCKKTNEPAATTVASGSSAPADPGSAKPAEPVGSGSNAAGPPSPEQVVKDVGLMTPESVLYDADADVYLVSNINGKPAEADDNGFISKLGPDGKMIELKWIDGAKPDVKLDAPKGTAISGGVLWVADITVVRKFDARTGKPLGDIEIPGATFLNDVAPAPDDGVYVTDSGLDAAFKPSGSDAVYEISKAGKVKALAKDKELGGPNGVLAVDGTVYTVTFRTGEIEKVGTKEREKLPKGQLDGIVALASDDLLVSSWEGKTVFRGAMGKWQDLMVEIESPADIGWDSKRHRLLIPSFNRNTITLLGM